MGGIWLVGPTGDWGSRVGPYYSPGSGSALAHILAQPTIETERWAGNKKEVVPFRTVGKARTRHIQTPSKLPLTQGHENWPLLFYGQ